MKRSHAVLVTLGVVAGLVLVGTLAVHASWPVVVGLGVLAALAFGVFAGVLWADRDTRLDAVARREALKAGAVVDELARRLKVTEERLAAVQVQSVLADRMRGLNGGG